MVLFGNVTQATNSVSTYTRHEKTKSSSQRATHRTRHDRFGDTTFGPSLKPLHPHLFFLAQSSGTTCRAACARGRIHSRKCHRCGSCVCVCVCVRGRDGITELDDKRAQLSTQFTTRLSKKKGRTEDMEYVQ